jgi:hypothetical protein
MVEWENDKPTVVALREVAEGYVGEAILEEREQPVEEFLDLDTTPAVLPEDILPGRSSSIGE